MGRLHSFPSSVRAVHGVPCLRSLPSLAALMSPRREPFLARLFRLRRGQVWLLSDPFRPVFFLLSSSCFCVKKINFSRPPSKKATSAIFDFCRKRLIFSDILKRPFCDCRLSPVKLFYIYIFLEYIYLNIAGGFLVGFAVSPLPFHVSFKYVAIATIYISIEVAVGVLEHWCIIAAFSLLFFLYTNYF